MKIILFFLAGTILLSCDPMRRIYIQNLSDGDAEIIWKIKEDSILCSPLFISNNPEVKFHLAPEPKKAINMSCGVGEWSMRALNEFTDDLESIELKWVGGTIKMNDADSIRSFLFNRRTGLNHGTISIRFSNPYVISNGNNLGQTNFRAPSKE
jgi:hypothetical protein